MFYDVVIEVAIIRPGPIQGHLMHPYLERRAGKGTRSPIGTTGLEPIAQAHAGRAALPGADAQHGDGHG